MGKRKQRADEDKLWAAVQNARVVDLVSRLLQLESEDVNASMKTVLMGANGYLRKLSGTDNPRLIVLLHHIDPGCVESVPDIEPEFREPSDREEDEPAPPRKRHTTNGTCDGLPSRQIVGSDNRMRIREKDSDDLEREAEPGMGMGDNSVVSEQGVITVSCFDHYCSVGIEQSTSPVRIWAKCEEIDVPGPAARPCQQEDFRSCTLPVKYPIEFPELGKATRDREPGDTASQTPAPGPQAGDQRDFPGTFCSATSR